MIHAFSRLDDAFRNDDGYQPTGALVDGHDGWIYGTTTLGGRPSAAVAASSNGGGVIYRIHLTSHQFQVVHHFGTLTGFAETSLARTRTPRRTSKPKFANATGAVPLGTLLQDHDGALMGTTFYGGQHGAGTVYRIQPDGKGFALLHSFGPPHPEPDGLHPSSGLVRAGDGALYGVCQAGGAPGPGTVYRLEQR